MWQSPLWKAHRSWASKEIPHTLWNLKGQYPVHDSLTFVPVLNHNKPLHVLPTYFVSLILILFYNPHMGLPCGIFTSGFSSKSLHAFLFFTYTCHMPFPPHPPWFNHPSMLWGCKPWLSLCNFLQSFVSPSLFGPNIFQSLLFSSILRLCSYFNVIGFYMHLKQQEKLHCIHTVLGLLPSYVLKYIQWEKSKVYEFKYHTPPSKPHRKGKIQFCILLIFMFCNWKLDRKYGLHGSRHPLNLINS